MTDRQRAENAYKKVLEYIFDRDDNPTYALAQITLEHLTSVEEVFLMEDFNLIKFVGNNSNGFPTYKIR